LEKQDFADTFENFLISFVAIDVLDTTCPTPDKEKPERFQKLQKRPSPRRVLAQKTKIGSRAVEDADEEATRIGVTDVLRVLGGVILLSSALSWFVTNDSILWGYRPAFTRPAVVRSWLVRPHSPSVLRASCADGD
jgi:hypothetical protein